MKKNKSAGTVDPEIQRQKKLANNTNLHLDEKKHIIPVGDISEYPADENAHVIGSNTFLDIQFDENFEYIIKNPVKRFFANTLWFTGMLFMPIVTGFWCGFRVKGDKYRRQVTRKHLGAVTVSNHVYMMDCVMACQANVPKMTYLPTLHTTFQLPYVRHIVHWLNAFPIPNTTRGMKKFISEVDGLLKKGRLVHFFPEAAMWPYYDDVRNFLPGAFHFAVRNNVPIIPMAIKFRPRRITKWITKKPLISLEILPPIYPDTTLPAKEATALLTKQAHDAIADCVHKNNLKYYGVESTKRHLKRKTPEEMEAEAIKAKEDENAVNINGANPEDTAESIKLKDATLQESDNSAATQDKDNSTKKAE